MAREQGDKKNNRYIWIGMLAVCLVGALVCLVIIGRRIAEQRRVEEELQALAEYAYLESLKENKIPAEDTGEGTENVPEEDVDNRTPLERDLDFIREQEIPLPELKIDFAALQADTNEDIYAWIYVPDTMINYPVLQHPTENSYYLDYNIDGTKGYPGCIYTENYNAKDFTDFNTVLYGHNMNNGSMFANLHKFEDSEFFDEHPYVYIYTEDRLLVYHVFASYEFSNIHLLLGYDTGSEFGIKNYLRDVFNVRDMGRNIREELFPYTDNHIITLSTCIKNKAASRYLVQGVLMNED